MSEVWRRIYSRNTQLFFISIIFYPNESRGENVCKIHIERTRECCIATNRNIINNTYIWLPPRLIFSESTQLHQRQFHIEPAIILSACERTRNIIDIYDKNIIEICKDICSIVNVSYKCANSIKSLLAGTLQYYMSMTLNNQLMRLVENNRNMRDIMYKTYKSITVCDDQRELEVIRFRDADVKWIDLFDGFQLEKYISHRTMYLQNLYCHSYSVYEYFVNYKSILINKINYIDSLASDRNKMILRRIWLNELNRVNLLCIYEYIRMRELYLEFDERQRDNTNTEMGSYAAFELQAAYRYIKMNNFQADICSGEYILYIIMLLNSNKIEKSIENNNDENRNINFTSADMFSLFFPQDTTKIIKPCWNLLLNTNEEKKITNPEETEYFFLYFRLTPYNNISDYYNGIMEQLYNKVLLLLDDLYNNNNYSGSFNVLKNRLIFNINRINESAAISLEDKERFSQFIENKTINNYDDLLNVLRKSDQIAQYNNFDES